MSLKNNIFKSKPFYHKYELVENLHSLLQNKLFWLLIFCILMFSLFVITIGIGYQPRYINVSVLPNSNGSNANHEELDSQMQALPQQIRTARAISIFFAWWYIVFSAWLFKLAIDMINQNQKKFGLLYCFNFLPLFNFGLLIYEAININYVSLKNYFKSWFENDPVYDNNKYLKNYVYIVVLVSVIISSPIIWIVIFRNNDFSIIFYSETGYKNNLWFNSFQYFTIQMNLVCFVALIAYLINPKWKLFKNKDVLIALSTYISIVCLTFNFIIFPTNFAEKYAGRPYKIVRTTFEHIINPILFVTSFILIMSVNNYNITDYGTTLKYSLIVPMIYGAYAFLTPITCGISVYSKLTNTNPELYMSNKPGSYLNFLIIFGFIAIFVAFHTLFWYINYLFNKKQKN